MHMNNIARNLPDQLESDRKRTYPWTAIRTHPLTHLAESSAKERLRQLSPFPGNARSEFSRSLLHDFC